jgi:hypothetical protein
MKKTLLIVFSILAVIIVLPVINLIQWNFQEKKPIDIILVDKTVPTLERDHHKSLSWILLNAKFVKRENQAYYSYIKDYYGFSPKRPLKEKQWEKNDYRLTDLINLAEKNDALYFADTYGVFFNDWYEGINKSRKSRKLYGGLNNNDFLLIKEMKDRNKLIILEYNSFDYPTAQFESVRVQEKLGIVFTGWTGRYFNSLYSTSQDFPIWMTSMYRKQFKKPWTFRKPGIVIISEREILVLEQGIHLKDAMPHIITESANCSKFGVAPSVAFDKWFDIVEPLQNSIISNFKIETTALGDTLLASNNLLSRFPAVLQDSLSHKIYYFSGDFATNNIPYWTAKFQGVSKLRGFLYSEKPDDPRRFFWLYYRPLMTGILTDYSTSTKAK